MGFVINRVVHLYIVRLNDSRIGCVVVPDQRFTYKISCFIIIIIYFPETRLFTKTPYNLNLSALS